MSITDEERTSRFLDAIGGYSGDCMESDLIDLMTDFLHYCAHNKQYNAQHILQMAQDHFMEEDDRA